LVYITQVNLNSLKLSEKDIIKNSSINRNDFGKLFILPDGKIYSNLNSESIGNIKTDLFQEAIYKELKYTKNWLKTRGDVIPCKNCIYKAICPPISNYERYLNKFNLCHLKI